MSDSRRTKGEPSCTEAEKAELEAQSGGNISAYVKQQLFGQDQTLETILHRLEDIADNLKDQHTDTEARHERPALSPPPVTSCRCSPNC